MTDKRHAYYTDESHQDPETGRFWVVRIEEDSPFFARLNSWETLAGAKEYADRLNSDIVGLSSDEFHEILSSALAAHIAKNHPDEIVVTPPTDAEIEGFLDGETEK